MVLGSLESDEPFLLPKIGRNLYITKYEEYILSDQIKNSEKPINCITYDGHKEVPKKL